MLTSAMKAMFALNITPKINAVTAWGSQWYQRNYTRAEKRAIFGYFPEKSEPVIKKSVP